MYSYKSRISFSEVDLDKNLTTTSIINHFQNCSTFHSQDVGLGFDYLNSVNRAWLVSSWQLEIINRPKFAANIIVGTWPYEFKSLLGYRNFVMLDEDGNTLAIANSIWVYYDTLNKRPAKILPENIKGYIIEPKSKQIDYLERKLYFPTDIEKIDAFPVKKSNLDTNQHVNNCEYIKMAQDYLPNDFTTKRLRVDYRKAAVFGDTIHVFARIDKEVNTIVLADESLVPYVILEFS